MFLAIVLHLSCFSHLLQLIKILWKFVLLICFSWYRWTQELRKWELKPRVLRVFVLYWHWAATQYLRLGEWDERDTCISLCAPSAISTGRAAAGPPCQQHRPGSACPVLQWERRLWDGIQSPSGLLLWFGRTDILAEITLVDPKCTCEGIILPACIDQTRDCLGSSESGFLSHPFKTFLRLHTNLQHK